MTASIIRVKGRIDQFKPKRARLKINSHSISSSPIRNKSQIKGHNNIELLAMQRTQA